MNGNGGGLKGGQKELNGKGEVFRTKNKIPTRNTGERAPKFSFQPYALATRQFGSAVLAVCSGLPMREALPIRRI